MDLNLKNIFSSAKEKATGRKKFRWKRKGLRFKDRLKAHNRQVEWERFGKALQREAFLIKSGARAATGKDRGGVKIKRLQVRRSFLHQLMNWRGTRFEKRGPAKVLQSQVSRKVETAVRKEA